MISPGLRIAVLICSFLTIFALNLVSAFADVTDTTRHQLAIGTGAAAFVAFLAGPWPRLRPPREQRAERAPVVAGFGRVLILATWLARLCVVAFGSFLFTTALGAPEFNAPAAFTVGIYNALGLVLTCGRWLTGFVVDWSFLRGWRGVRYVAGLAAGVVITGYAGFLAEVVQEVVFAVPAGIYEALRGWGFWSWLAVTATALATVVFVLVLVIVESALQHLAARILGRNNAVGAWLERNAPARVVVNDVAYVFQLRFPIELSWPKLRDPERVAVLNAKRYGKYEQPLDDDERTVLMERIADVLAQDLPPRWSNVSLTYRAAGRHEELVLRRNVMSAPDEHGVSVGQSTETELTDFPELDALRRLRADGYQAGYGTPFQWCLHFSAERTFYRDDTVPARGRAHWNPVYTEDEPEWIRPPSRQDYREDLERFPIKESVRPVWLRRRLAT